MLVSAEVLVSLYVAFAAKHFVGDYLLQTADIAGAKGRISGWRHALLLHAGIHAAGTLLIALAVAPALWWLAAVDLVVHATVDRTKANIARGWTVGEPRYWWAFGLDQAAHQLTHFAFLLMLLTAL